MRPLSLPGVQAASVSATLLTAHWKTKLNATSAFAVFFCVFCKSKVKMYIHILLYIQILYVHTELQMCASEGVERKNKSDKEGK